CASARVRCLGARTVPAHDRATDERIRCARRVPSQPTPLVSRLRRRRARASGRGDRRTPLWHREASEDGLTKVAEALGEDLREAHRAGSSPRVLATISRARRTRRTTGAWRLASGPSSSSYVVASTAIPHLQWRLGCELGELSEAITKQAVVRIAEGPSLGPSGAVARRPQFERASHGCILT